VNIFYANFFLLLNKSQQLPVDTLQLYHSTSLCKVGLLRRAQHCAWVAQLLDVQWTHGGSIISLPPPGKTATTNVPHYHQPSQVGKDCLCFWDHFFSIKLFILLWNNLNTPMVLAFWWRQLQPFKVATVPSILLAPFGGVTDSGNGGSECILVSTLYGLQTDALTKDPFISFMLKFSSIRKSFQAAIQQTWRRLRGDLIKAYECVNVFLSVPSKRTKGNRDNLEHRNFHLNIRKNLFTMRATEHWNMLPKEVMEPPSLQIFKTWPDAYPFHLLQGTCFSRHFNSVITWGPFQPLKFQDSLKAPCAYRLLV